MTIFVSGQLLSDPPVSITSTAITVIFTATKRTLIGAILVCPTTGTPTLSISVFDGTNRRYRRKAAATVAGTPTVDDTPFFISSGDVLEITSSSVSGDMDAWVTYVNPDAQSGEHRPTGGA